jgi:hypothetical protein
MPRPKGLPRTGGRKKGTPNKLTADLRESWLDAIAYANGKKGYTLRDWATRDAESNQRFWTATLQLLPKNVEVSGTLTLESLLADSHKAKGE